MKEERVTVIIPAYNSKKALEVCIQSLSEQTYRNFEIVVIDDSSTDGTKEMLEENFPYVKVIFNKTQKGPENSRNIGIKNITSKYIASLDADAKVDKNWLKELVKAIELDGDIGMCSCKILKFHNPEIIDNIGHGLYYDFSPIHIGEGEKGNNEFNKPREVFGLCLAGALIKREVFEKCGLFDKDYYHNFGGDEWVWRARLLGYRCVYVPEAIMYHKRLDSGRLNKRVLFFWERNRIWSILKYYPLDMIIISIFYTLKRYTTSLFSYLFTEKKEYELPLCQIIPTIFYAWWQALRKFPLFIRKRKEIQRIFKAPDSKIKLWLNKSWQSGCK